MSIVDVQGLRIAFSGAAVLEGVDLRIEPGECVAVVGESGAGKSLLGRALLGLHPADAAVTAERFEIAGRDVRGFREAGWRRLRGSTVGLVAQDALAALDPLQRIGSAIAEPMRLRGRPPADLQARVRGMLERVAVPEPERRARQHPHELSGGLRQRALIASALAGEPELLIADEPTTALDATVQARVLDLLRGIADAGTAVLFISHDMSAVRRVADRVVVLRAGRVAEQGAAAEVFAAPREEYTRELIRATEHTPRPAAPATSEALLEAEGLSKSFGGVPAVRAASFRLAPGRTLGIVGESGSGKTTIARMLLGVELPDVGVLRWTGDPRVRLVHQNPLGAFDPRWTLGRSLREALQAAGVPRGARAGRVAELFAEVGLDPQLAARRPWQVSGGQRQRAAIARALAADPDVLVLDEPVSALDATVRERVLSLLRRVQSERGLTMVLISHDLDVVAAVADDVLVVQGGAIVEQGPVAEVFVAPRHPFTRELVAAAR